MRKINEESYLLFLNHLSAQILIVLNRLSFLNLILCLFGIGLIIGVFSVKLEIVKEV